MRESGKVRVVQSFLLCFSKVVGFPLMISFRPLPVVLRTFLVWPFTKIYNIRLKIYYIRVNVDDQKWLPQRNGRRTWTRPKTSFRFSASSLKSGKKVFHFSNRDMSRVTQIFPISFLSIGHGNRDHITSSKRWRSERFI